MANLARTHQVTRTTERTNHNGRNRRRCSVLLPYQPATSFRRLRSDCVRNSLPTRQYADSCAAPSLTERSPSARPTSPKAEIRTIVLHAVPSLVEGPLAKFSQPSPSHVQRICNKCWCRAPVRSGVRRPAELLKSRGNFCKGKNVGLGSTSISPLVPGVQKRFQSTAGIAVHRANSVAFCGQPWTG